MNNVFQEKDYENEKFKAGIWKKIIKLVVKRKGHMTIMIIAVLGLVALDIIYPLLNAYAIEHFFSENPDFSTTGLFIIWYALVALGYGITVYGFIKMGGYVEADISYEIKSEAFKKLQELPFAYYDKTPAGWIMARLTSDSRRLASIISWGIIDMLWGGLNMVGILIILYIKEARLALIITCLLPILLVVSIYFRKRILKSYRKVRKINSQITANYNEGIMGSKTTKTLVLEEKRNEEFSGLCIGMRKSSIKAILNSAIFFPILLFLSYIAVMATLRSGSAMVLDPSSVVDIALLYLFIQYTMHFFDPIMQIARILAELQQAQASAERILSLIEHEPEIFDTKEVIDKYGTLFAPKYENWEIIKGDVDFENVTFKYVEGETILKNFNLKIAAGSSVALVGTTGAGKSTIVNLVCRFYEPSSGVIKIDGSDYKNRSMGWLHANLGYVLQTPHLFNGTIMENIRYGNLNATDDEVIEAAKLVNADSFIVDFENGYDTNVGEGGAKLSVGQRQLISFARAILADPKILILDEATSSIDTETERIIQDVTQKLLTGRTSFIVAHRLSTIINADVILVIKDGEIIEQGSHNQLLKLKGQYYELYKNQFINEKRAELEAKL